MQALKLAAAMVLVASTAVADRLEVPTPPLQRQADGPRPPSSTAGFRGPERPPVRRPPQPRPDPKTAAVAKETAGSWTCTGAVDKVTIAAAQDGAWIQWTIVGGAGTTVQYRTYDGTAKQWSMIELTSSGKHRTLTSLGPAKDPKDLWTWTLDDHRELETFTKTTLELTGERRGGTAWAKHYSASCTRK